MLYPHCVYGIFDMISIHEIENYFDIYVGLHKESFINFDFNFFYFFL